MENRIRNLKWIVSAGGPLLLMEIKSLPHWHGIFGGQSDVGKTTDYARACEVDDYVGLIGVNDSQGLVLGEEPMHTSWFPISDSEGIVVRWVWADDEQQVEAVLNTMSLNHD